MHKYSVLYVLHAKFGRILFKAALSWQANELKIV